MPNSLRGQTFLEELATMGSDLPFSPKLLRDLFSMTSQGSTSTVEDVAEVVGQDPSLAARVLSLANSAYYGLQANVTSLARALAILGMREIRNLVLMVGMKGVAEAKPLPPCFGMDDFWRHGLGVAECAKLIADRVEGMDRDLLFTAGLLHDFGKLITALHRPEDYAAIHALHRDGHLPQFEAEDRHWGLEHGMVGAMVLGAWDLPSALTEPVNWHHAPGLGGDYTRAAAVVCLADGLAHALLMDEREEPGEPGPAEDWEGRFDELGLDRNTVESECATRLADPNLFQLLANL